MAYRLGRWLAAPIAHMKRHQGRRGEIMRTACVHGESRASRAPADVEERGGSGPYVSDSARRKRAREIAEKTNAIARYYFTITRHSLVRVHFTHSDTTSLQNVHINRTRRGKKGGQGGGDGGKDTGGGGGVARGASARSRSRPIVKPQMIAIRMVPARGRATHHDRLVSSASAANRNDRHAPDRRACTSTSAPRR